MLDVCLFDNAQEIMNRGVCVGGGERIEHYKILIPRWPCCDRFAVSDCPCNSQKTIAI
jgi:hypothetical protein